MLGGIFYALGFSYWWLVTGAILEGLARAFYSGNNDALLYDSLNKSKRKGDLEKSMGYIGSAEQWALGIAALLGGILAAKFSLTLVMWLSIIPLGFCFFSSWWLVEVKDNKIGEGNIYRHLKEAIKNFLNNKKIRLLSLSGAIGSGLGEAGFQFTSVFVLTLWPLWAVGVARMLSNISAAIGFGLSGKIIKRFKAINILLFEQISSKIINLTALVVPTVTSPAWLASTSFMYGPSDVAQNSLLQKEFSHKQRATMGSLNSLLSSLMFAIAAIFLGWLADTTNSRMALIIGQVAGLTSVWLTWKLYKLIKAEPNKSL